MNRALLAPRNVGHALRRRKVQISIQRAAEENAVQLIRAHLVPGAVPPRPGSLARALFDRHEEVVASGDYWFSPRERYG